MPGGNDIASAETPPVASLLAYLLTRLGWEDTQVRPFADYFRLARMLSRHSGGAINMAGQLSAAQPKRKPLLVKGRLNFVTVARGRGMSGGIA
jgi:hypothetical protein